MSKVFSFRLDANNPREAQARKVIEAWVSQGYSLRNILTDALIRYGGNGESMNMWERVYDQLIDIAKGLENGLVEKEPVREKPPLSQNFVAATKQGAREGIRSK